MKLAELIASYPGNSEIIGNAQTEIGELVTDSRSKSNGGLFFCIPGLHSDGHDFAGQAAANGAAALVVERVLDNGMPQIKVDSVRRAMSYIAASFYGNPSARLKMIGITGTKGKTTTSYMLKSIIEAAGYKTGLIGTVCILIGDDEYETGKTTPDPVDFQRILKEMADAGVQYAIMEVSAHALDVHRIDGIRFESAGFTNLSQDHLDYFGTMENYLKAKTRITEFTGNLTVNADDKTVAEAFRAEGVPFVRAAISANADVYAKNVGFNETGAEFELCFHKKERSHIQLRLTGLFNVYNALIAASVASDAGIGFESIVNGLEKLRNVPGRVELLDTGTDYRVILDYAHSPDALENILKTLRNSVKGRLIVLFGCGGDRDKLKRPIMGEIAGRLADYSVVTSDNPRNEEPMSIITEIIEGIRPVTDRYTVVENRREAIKYVLTHAEAGDTVVLAGKGHETYQEISGVKHPFDEKVIVQQLLEEIQIG